MEQAWIAAPQIGKSKESFAELFAKHSLDTSPGKFGNLESSSNLQNLELISVSGFGEDVASETQGVKQEV